MQPKTFLGCVEWWLEENSNPDAKIRFEFDGRILEVIGYDVNTKTFKMTSTGAENG